jgi:hypothetical protein
VDPVQVESLPHAGQLSLISASLAMLTQPGNNFEKFVNLNFKYDILSNLLFNIRTDGRTNRWIDGQQMGVRRD